VHKWNQADFDYTFSNPYGDAYTGDVFPAGDGQYSMAEFAFTGGGYIPTFNVYYEDGTLVESGVSGLTYTDIGLEASTQYCYYVTQILEGGEESLPSNVECATTLPGGTPIITEVTQTDIR